ncbi:glutathione S-transferase family protein [Novosphingobium profundi]|uniref:glutathione S-transferase family protein n=1 Tax=Novosphingobium profundi TaxID=1774954 RepID=UPI001BD9DEF0|nr:glutathione S-transferase family protein [Novosphingobium profundi]MBT0669166.1 glutathione S-transferase family protein [Novosphingobium profundi]
MKTLHIADWTPQALSVALTLAEKGLPFEVEHHDWRALAQALEGFTATLEPGNTLEGEFPLLVDGDATLCDSHFILEYLDDACPEPALRPDDAYGQWRLQALARFLGERVAPAIASLGVSRRFADAPATTREEPDMLRATSLPRERRDAWAAALAGPISPHLRDESQRKIGLFLERIESELDTSGGPWLLGTRFTLSDIAAFVLAKPVFEASLGVDFAPGARAARWFEQVAGRAAVASVLADQTMAFLPGPEHARWG